MPNPRIPKGDAQACFAHPGYQAGHFDSSAFKDEFELELRKLVNRKAAGKTIERPSNVVDLMEALRQRRYATAPTSKFSARNARQVPQFIERPPAPVVWRFVQGDTRQSAPVFHGRGALTPARVSGQDNE